MLQWLLRLPHQWLFYDSTVKSWSKSFQNCLFMVNLFQLGIVGPQPPAAGCCFSVLIPDFSFLS